MYELKQKITVQITEYTEPFKTLRNKLIYCLTLWLIFDSTSYRG